MAQTSAAPLERASRGDLSSAVRARVACLPPLATNPYQRLLYGALAPLGVELVGDARLKLGWLVSSRRSVDVLHFHWPEGYYRFRHGPACVQRAASWLDLGAFALRVRAAKALGFRVVWTVHQVRPHESHGRIDGVAAKVLARLADELVAHDEHTAAAVGRELGRAATVIPHGSYVDVYEPGPGRRAARERLGLGEDDVVFLLFGHLRAYKDVDLVLDAWLEAELGPRARLLIVGMTDLGAPVARIRAAAAADPRIVTLLEFVPDERVGEIYSAADVALVARGDGGTSGALVLALSLGVPAIVSARPAYLDLTVGDDAGWSFSPGDPSSLAAALERAAGDPEGVRSRADAALGAAARLDWGPIAAETARILSA